jgi:hypothetical protein
MEIEIGVRLYRILDHFQAVIIIIALFRFIRKIKNSSNEK